MQDVNVAVHTNTNAEQHSPSLGDLLNALSPTTMGQDNSISISRRPSSDTIPQCSQQVSTSPAPLLQFDWNQTDQFDLNQEPFDFLTHSNDVNVQLQRLMDMSFLNPLEAELAPSPFPRQPLPGSHLSVLSPQNLMSYERSEGSPSSPPSTTIWRSLEKGRWSAQVEQVRDEEQVLHWRRVANLENVFAGGVS
jgi:hypothetical protein